MVLLYFFLFILGASLGSFLNVLIDRIPSKRSLFLSRSECEHCRKKIPPYDLIPLVSYVLLKGKCRNCHAKIPVRIFLVELASATLLPAAFFFAFINPVQFIFLIIILLIILAISVIDIEKGIIPDKLLLSLGVVSFAYLLSGDNAPILTHLGTAFLAFSFFLLLFLVTRGKGIGFGDVKFAFFIGFLLSVRDLIIVFYSAFLTGAFVSIILVLWGVKKLKGESIPFGPFLSLGVLTALLFGQEILKAVFEFLNF